MRKTIKKISRFCVVCGERFSTSKNESDRCVCSDFCQSILDTRLIPTRRLAELPSKSIRLRF